MTSAIRAQRDAEDGFTLIELLVVVIIIGILAAIAIPAFLNQRDRARQAELTSDVRNFALEVEADATANNGTYPAAGAVPSAPTGVGQNVTFYYTQLGGGTGFTLCGTHNVLDGNTNGTGNDNDENVTYNSTAGGMQDYAEAACTTAGATVVS